MWWAIGFVVAIFLLFLVSKFRAASHHLRLVTAAQNHLGLSLRMLSIFDREIDDRVWHDPYLLGFAQGTAAMLTQFYGGKLSTMQKGMVTVDTVKGLAGDEYGAVLDRISNFHEVCNPEFQRGMVESSNVAILMANKPGPDLLADPDVQISLRDAPAMIRASAEIFGASSGGPTEGAGAALLQIYMRRHKQTGGYSG